MFDLISKVKDKGHNIWIYIFEFSDNGLNNYNNNNNNNNNEN